MPGYYDSSLLLAAVLGQTDAVRFADAWDNEDNRLSSILLKAECITALRRAGLAQGSSPTSRWTRERVAALDEYFDTVTFKFVDASVEEIVRREHLLAGCRTLDAIHLATALHFQSHLADPLRICSLDHRFRQVAAKFGFTVLPREV